ncbi:MAG: biotin/lipoyl-binding protein [Clostridiaceae bacterium]|nr:biotin/lipoyl-binding protein [Clostridiaceae bacterium]
MMKKYKITVEGKTYEVEVEEMGASAATPLAVAPLAAAAPAPDAGKTEPVPKPETPKSAAVSPDSIAGEKLPAPMPGTILSVSVSAGQSVTKGQVLLVLEAMKMENEIVAHKDGVISGVFVQKGSSVNAGDPLVAFAG